MKQHWKQTSLLAVLFVVVSTVPLTYAGSQNIIQDSSFEQGRTSTPWIERSTNFDNMVICTLSTCRSNIGFGPRTGTAWAWLGHGNTNLDEEVGSITQFVNFPAGTLKAQLSFWLKMPVASGTGRDLLRVMIDNEIWLTIPDRFAPFYEEYQEITLDVSDLGPGFRRLTFEAVVQENNGTSYFIDDVALTVDDGKTYLPLTLKNYCADPFVFNEDITLLYNIININAPEGWLTTECGPQGDGIIVAVLDTGVDLDHPDLQPNLLPGRDFAGTGRVDDVDGHGTHVAGVIAAIANNEGVIGVAPQTKILPINVLEGPSGGRFSTVAQAIIWAVDNEADILNLSLGGTNPSQTLKNALNYAYDRGVFVVAAAGNCGGSTTYSLNGCEFLNQPKYPAAYDDVALAVGSTNQSNGRSVFSTQGDFIDIVAPGDGIISDVPGGGLGVKSGTSHATPHVAGLAALIWSRHPSLSHLQIWAIIRDSADPLGRSVPNVAFGYGLIDVAEALRVAADDDSPPIVTRQQPTTATPSETPGSFAPGEILVKLRPGRRLSGLLPAVGLKSNEVQLREKIAPLDVQLFTVPVGREVEVVKALQRSPEVVYAELNYWVTAE